MKNSDSHAMTPRLNTAGSGYGHETAEIFLMAGVDSGAIIGLALSPGMDGDRGALFVLACAGVGLIDGFIVDAFHRSRR